MYYTVLEVAKMFRVRKQTVLAWIHRGQIEYVRLPGGMIRIPQEAVKKLTAVLQ